ncbi:MAG: UvrD-helicase domain-containing protein, partial [Clostridia bacterium]|nr:UvrD-helicase domain-containing protein [Clostridia bacterium]
MAIEFTKAQQRAIETEGNVLVSAAAGSGKTAVLVERVITLMTRKENPIAADRLLIVTFTNAAAAEMRLRIESRLDEVCRENPQDRGLLRQKRLLANAKICTIDSFCIDLVRENFEKAGVSPDFKMSDAISLKAIDERVMAEITNEYIESKNEIFFELLDIIGAEYDERNFNEKVLEIYNYSRQLPEPEKWFKSFCEPFGKAFDEHNIWYNYSFDAAIKKIKSLRKSLAIIIDKIGLYEAASERFMPTLMLLSELLYELEKTAEKRVWNDFREKLLSFNLPEKPNARGFGGICVVSAVKTLFETISKGTEKLKKLFERSAEENEEQFIYLDKPISLLCEILICLQERLLEEYLKENTLTFHNTEHLALKLLTQTEGEEFLNLYDEVMVDEYQDTNDLQDRLFYVLSAYERKLFAVGDVKQSIYGFRGANPINFLEKKNRYISIDEAKQDDAKKIILSNNFRSNEEICSFVNFFFENIMTEENAGLDYGEEERLVASADYRKNKKAVELQVIDCKDSENSAAVCEALAIAKYIKSVMSSGECIKKDKDSYREAKFSDFAILMRATKNKADKLAEILRQCGIPVNFSVEGFAERNE